MSNTNSLGKITKTIGLITLNLFSILWFLALLLTRVSSFSNQQYVESTEMIGVFIGSIIGIVLFGYFGIRLLKFLLRPGINFGQIREQYLNNEINTAHYESKWKGNLYKSIAFSVLLAFPTVGISVLLMIPNFLLLSKTKL